MYVVFDYQCPVCGHVEADKLTLRDEHLPHCPTCLWVMKRLPAGTKTHFKFADQKLKR